MTLAPGTRLGTYEISSALGAGGMGEVYRARDTKLRREVAIKVLPAELSRDNHALARFEREARAAAALSHPNVLGIHDFDSDAGIAYAVLELLEGRTLREWIAAGPVPPRKAVEWMVQGDRDGAMAWLTDAAHNGFPSPGFFGNDPLLATLRSDPRYVSLVSDLNVECAGYRELWRSLRARSSDPGVSD